LGIDRDPRALEAATQTLKDYQDRCNLIQGSYRNLPAHLNKLNWEQVSGILVDLGLSSLQLGEAERGFSFQEEGPLDMRFDPSQPRTAADIVNTFPREELANLIYRFGEERSSRKIADAIVANRPLKTTRELAALIESVLGRSQSRIHPATRTFQALRIAVNRELAALNDFLPKALQSLEPGGRLAVIAFHSLEDRIVKQFFRRESADCLCPPGLPVCACDHQAQLREITRRPIRPGEEERAANPRSRSAKLRVAEKL
jgi:16S rRNA (cytosine1402-N4)-methyltransferase